MIAEIKTFTNCEDNVRFTFYQTWFNKNIVIVSEKKLDTDDWKVQSSLSLPKTILNKFSLSTIGLNVSNNDESIQHSSDFTQELVMDRFSLPMEVRKILFECDCDEIPLSENQLGYFSDLETLEWFWDMVEEEKSSFRSQKGTPPSPFQEPLNEDSTQEGEQLICHGPTDEAFQEKKTGDVCVCEPPVTPQIMDTKEMSCPPRPKKQKFTKSFTVDCSQPLFSP